MKAFIGILCVLVLAVGLFLYFGQSRTAPENNSANGQSSAQNQSTASTATDNPADSENPAADNNPEQRVSTRFSGNIPNSTADNNRPRNRVNEVDEDIEHVYRTTDDLAVLYQQLQSPSSPEDYYYRYRILQECNDLRLRGIDAQLNTCEQIAEHSAGGSNNNPNLVEQSFTASEIAEACFRFTERCSTLDFDNIDLTPAQALQEAVDQGSVLARAANLYQISSDDPLGAREWLVAALDEQPGADLLRHAASFLRSDFRLRDQPFFGAVDNQTMLLAERALDLTACRFDQGCNAGGHFMLERCNYLPGCLPWQSYEQWLFQNYSGNQENLNHILQLSQDYQQLLLNQQAELLVFPDLIDADGE